MIATAPSPSFFVSHPAPNVTLYTRAPQAAPSAVSIDGDYQSAERDAAACREFLRLKNELHYSGNQAADYCGRSPAWFSKNILRWQRHGLAAFLPERRELGAARKLFTDLPAWFLPVAKFYYLNTNLNSCQGSVPEAIRCTISLPKCPNAIQRRLIKVCLNAGWQSAAGETLPSCPPELREAILARAKAGKAMLPASLTRQISVSAPFVRHHRNPKDANLDYISASGTQMWIVNSESGEKQFIRGGDVVEADDATINMPVCVPWPMRGCPCSERYEVKVARYQWLVSVDVGSRKVLAYSYTARPRSSYRAEDILALLRAGIRQHGIPRIFRLERGAWESHLVRNAIQTVGAGRIAVHSPHCKPFIEGLFNQLWTKLSYHFPDSQVGRFRGENKAACDLLTACQAGHQDPRKHFPMLADVLGAFDQVIAEHNSHLVISDNYGRWIPNERWANDTAARPLAPLNPASDWIFSPFVRTWTVRGHNVGGKIPLMEGVSIPHEFSAPWLLEFHGHKVRCHFDPSEPQCAATIVLAQAVGNHRAGEVLGAAIQTNETTGHIRLALGWGDDSPDLGRQARRQAEQAMRRVTRAINGPVGRDSVEPKYSADEHRDGLGRVTRISSVPGHEHPGPTDESASRLSARGLPSSPSHKSPGPTGADRLFNARADAPPYGDISGRITSSVAGKPATDEIAQFEAANPQIFV
jgi:hypothetical protein